MNFDTAIFDLSNTYTVTFDVTTPNIILDLFNGNVTFALSGQTLNATGGGVIVGPFGKTGRLTVLNGQVVSTGVSVGTVSAATGFLTISTGAEWSATSGTFAVGDGGSGTLTISGGGQLTSIATSIGRLVTGVGAATVTGSDSLWTIAAGGSINVGQSGSARSRFPAAARSSQT